MNKTFNSNETESKCKPVYSTELISSTVLDVTEEPRGLEEIENDEEEEEGSLDEKSGAVSSNEDLTESHVTTPEKTEKLVYDSKKRSSIRNKDEAELDKKVPKVNCPEKIVICIDLSSDMESLPFKLGDGSRYSPLYMIKRVVEIFVYSKHRIDRRHQFALVVLHESALWLRNFTNDPKEICNVLEDVTETKQCDTCDFSSLFEAITEKVDLPVVALPEILPPPFVLRTILIYCQSNVVPEFLNGLEEFKKLQQSSYFFLDVLYIHGPPSNNNKCQEIYEFLCDLDEKYTSYIFEVTRNTTKLHNCMAKLLAHPLQRPFQKDVYYKIQAPGE